MNRRPPWWLIIIGLVVSLWLVAPALIVIPLSFTGKPSFEFPPTSWSTRWYENFFSDPEWHGALLTSLGLAICVSILAVILGTLAAYALVRGRFHGRAAVTSLILAPMVVPIIVVGVAMLGVFLSWKLADNFWGFLIAHTVLAVPFVVITVGTSLGGVDPAIERAAVSLGAPPLVGWRRVTLPLILPGVLAGALFAFVTSFDEVVIALYLKGPNFSTLPVKMYTSVTSEVDPTIAAASTLILLFTTTLILLPLFIRRRHHAE